jgi:hypothetical protein
MSSPEKPRGPGKPFLPDADLSAELDAWDATFDALHGEESGVTVSAPPMDWPDQTIPSPPPRPTPRALAPIPPPVHEPDDRVADNTLDDHVPGFDPPVPEIDPNAFDLDTPPTEMVDEVDFSDLGAEEPPAAMGAMLGTQRPKHDSDNPFEDNVYTSASRPRVATPPSGISNFDDDDLVTPPPAVAPVPQVIPDKPRTGPAIIRRTSGTHPVQKPSPVLGKPSDFDESPTRIADFAEVQAAAREKEPTKPPPIAEPEDDYADIEIGGSESEPAKPAEPEAPARGPAARPSLSSMESPRRTVAHVVRRELGPTSSGRIPIPQVAAPATAARGDDRAAAPTAGSTEADFSDVAAAVGAEDDLSIAPPIRRPPTSSGDAEIEFELEVPFDTPAPSDTIRGTPDMPLVPHDIGPPPPRLGDASDASPMRAREASAPPPTRSRDTSAPPPMRPHEPSEPPPMRARESSAPPQTAPAHAPPALDVPLPRVKTPTSVPPLGKSPTTPPLNRTPTAPPPLAKTPTPFDENTQAVTGIRRAPRLASPVVLERAQLPDVELAIDLEALRLPEQLQPLPSAQLDEDCAAALLVYEREIATVDESSASAALRVEAGRLCERLGDVDRARAHYDAALLADPRATAGLRGLRRIARSQSDLVEATRQLDAEIAVAGALERRPLAHYRVDLLLASGEQDLARVAVGELLDAAPSDVRALLAQLELAFLDGRADEFGAALEQLAHAISDPQLRAAVQSARALLAAHQNDHAATARWFASAAESDPESLAARLGAIRSAASQNDVAAATRAQLELARGLVATDPATAAAYALRAADGDAAAAAQLALAVAPDAPLVAQLAATNDVGAPDDPDPGAAYARWAALAAAPAAERAYAAARAAEVQPARAAELWSLALELDPADDYAAAQLRTAHVSVEATDRAIQVDRAVARDPERDRARLRAAFGMIAQGQLDEAIALLHEGRAARPGSLALAEALAEALAAAGRWGDRAKLLGELASMPGDQLDKGVARLRAAVAWEEAVGAAAAAEQRDDAEVQVATAAALRAWDALIEDPGSHDGAGAAATAHSAQIALANRLGDRDVIADVLARAQAAERTPAAALGLALRRARLAEDPDRAEAIVREAPADDPRRAVELVVRAAVRGDLGDAAAALDERASHGVSGESIEAATIRLRAAQLALDGGDAARATALLEDVARVVPSLSIVDELLATARRRSGDRSGPIRMAQTPTVGGAADAFARVVRDADLAAQAGDGAAALGLYQRALELRPGDPLAAVPLVRAAMQLREPAPIAALALARLRAAEDAKDPVAKAEAYELLADIDRELRGDSASAQIALESASQADPTRIDLMHRLEREYTTQGKIDELLRLRRAEIEQTPADPTHAGDRAALVMDAAALAARDDRPDAELVELYRATLGVDPRHRLALLHLESIVRRGGASRDLAQLEEQIAEYFASDARAQAAFYTRAGESLAETGAIDEAVRAFGKAEAALPGHVPALEGWRAAALKGQLWVDVAEAAMRQASAASDIKQRGELYHFAGVALMDKALVNDRAQVAFRRALESDPSHTDSFLRLRILLEEDANHDELATVLTGRLDYEADERKRIELHRALAELCRNFLDDRETAKKHYREILVADPNDLRSHAAVADIAWEQGAWQEAADALVARARLESDPETLKTLCYRLGLIYADRIVDVPMALKAFQRALTYQPDDEQTLIRLADLATHAGEWKLALGACERLVKSEKDLDKRAAHLHRVAKIFKNGFGDAKRAERALNLALDGAPTNDAALDALVQFYKDAGDMTSVRVHLNRVAGAMRVRLAHDPKDGVAYRVISRAMAARAAAGVDGSLPIAFVAAELAQLFGAAGEPEAHVLAAPPRIDLGLLARSEVDEVLFPRAASPELRQMFARLGDRVAKHVGVDLRAYGVGRGDRLRARDHHVASVAQAVASGLGYGEIDIYISARAPHAMVAEPTSPVSLVIGAAIAQGDPRGVQFATGSALKLAQAQLAIPARLVPEELGVLVVALLRVFQHDFPSAELPEDAINAQNQKLRRLIPSGLTNELRPLAQAIDPVGFDPRALAVDLAIAGARAGVVSCGSALVALQTLAAAAGAPDVATYLADPIARGVITFALGEDLATVTR